MVQGVHLLGVVGNTGVYFPDFLLGPVSHAVEAGVAPEEQMSLEIVFPAALDLNVLVIEAAD